MNALLIAVGLSGSVLVLLKQIWPSLLGSLCLLGWSFAEGLRLLWEEYKEEPGEAFSAVLGDHPVILGNGWTALPSTVNATNTFDAEATKEEFQAAT